MKNNRVGQITTDLIEAIGAVCVKHSVTHDEYRNAVDFVSQAIDAGGIRGIESQPAGI